MRRPSWIQSEDEVLLNNIKNNPNNLQEAFRITSTQIDRSIPACTKRWYGQTSNTGIKYQGLKDSTPVFMTISGKTNNVNRKIVTQDTSDNTIKSNNSIWKKLVSLFKL